MQKYRYPLLAFAIIFPLVAAYFYFAHYDATLQTTWVNQCTFHHITGLLCPGCGGQRAFHSLLHGDLLQALRYNGLFILGLPVLAYLYYLIIRVYILDDKRYLNSYFFSSRFAYIFAGVIVLYFILRNIPLFPFSLLAPH